MTFCCWTIVKLDATAVSVFLGSLSLFRRSEERVDMRIWDKARGEHLA